MGSIWIPARSALDGAPTTGTVLGVDSEARELTVQIGDTSVDGVGWHGIEPTEGDLVYLTNTGNQFVAIRAGQGEVGEGGVWFSVLPPENPEIGQVWVDAAHPSGANLLPTDVLTNTSRWQWQASGYAEPAGTLTVDAEADGMRVGWTKTLTASSGGMVAAKAEVPFPAGHRLYGVIVASHESAGTLYATFPFAVSSAEGSGEGPVALLTEWVAEVGTAQDGALFGPQLVIDADDQGDVATTLITEIGVYDLDAGAQFISYVWTGSAWHVVGAGNEISIGDTAPTDGSELWYDTSDDADPGVAPYVQRAGDTMTGPLVLSPPGGLAQNLHAASMRGSSPSLTGYLLITLPGPNALNAMCQLAVRGYDYTPASGEWRLDLGGYAYQATPTWVNTSARAAGLFPGGLPSLPVRFLVQGSANNARFAIALGEASTVWNYPQVVLEVLAGHSGYPLGGQPGYSISVVGSLSGWTTNVTETPLALAVETDWATLAMQNGWTSNPPLRWRRLTSGLICVSGTGAGGTVGSGVACATLPAGARPGWVLEFLTPCSGGGSARISVTAAGAINVTQLTGGTNAWVSLTLPPFSPA